MRFLELFLLASNWWLAAPHSNSHPRATSSLSLLSSAFNSLHIPLNQTLLNLYSGNLFENVNTTTTTASNAYLPTSASGGYAAEVKEGIQKLFWSQLISFAEVDELGLITEDGMVVEVSMTSDDVILGLREGASSENRMLKVSAGQETPSVFCTHKP